MTNIGEINFGSYFSTNSIPTGQKIFSFGDFEIFKDCSSADRNFYIEELNIRNNPTTKNTRITSELFEGVKFFKEQYSLKDIRLKCSMFETPTKTIDDLIVDVKNQMESIKSKIEIYYRGELVYLTAILEGAIKFTKENDIWYFEANFVGEPFFKSYVNQSVDGNISGSNGIVQLLNEGNRIFPKVRVKPTGNAGGLAVGDSAGRIRYIRNSLNGSTSNNGSHFVELKAFEKVTGTNIALGKPVIGYLPTGNSYQVFTDGITSSGSYASGNSDGYNYLQIDLGNIYDIEKIQMWHYYADSRKYHNNKLEVSLDGLFWYTVFDSEIDGEYKETSLGKTIYLEDKITDIDGKRMLEEEITTGDILDFDFESGKVFKNGFPVSTNGTLPILKSNSKLMISGVNKENYPAFDQEAYSFDGTAGYGGIKDVNYDSDYYRIGHYFPAHGITNLKRISVGGSSEYAYSVDLIFTLYTSTAKTTQIAQFTKTVYGGVHLNDVQFEIDIDGYGLDVSAYPNIFMQVYVSNLSSIPDSLTDFFEFRRTGTGDGTGESYDYNMTIVDWNWEMKLEGYSGSYEPTLENLSAIEYEIDYYNNFL